MNSDNAINHLNKVVNPISGGTRLTIGTLIKILQQYPTDSEVFVFDTFEELDVPLYEVDVYPNPENTEVHLNTSR